jgi:flavin-dependent dehydrogenase
MQLHAVLSVIVYDVHNSIGGHTSNNTQLSNYVTQNKPWKSGAVNIAVEEEVTSTLGKAATWETKNKLGERSLYLIRIGNVYQRLVKLAEKCV